MLQWDKMFHQSPIKIVYSTLTVYSDPSQAVLLDLCEEQIYTIPFKSNRLCIFLAKMQRNRLTWMGRDCLIVLFFCR